MINMQWIISAIGKRVLIVSLMSLLSFSGLFIFSSQPAFADQKAAAEAAITRADDLSEASELKEEDRQEAYEEATEAVANPKVGLEKIYEEDLKEYKEENPSKNVLVEGAKELVEKVTGKN
jgi:hypothetical protein